MEFTEISNNVFVRSDSINIMFEKREYITVDGKEYSREERHLGVISLIEDYNNQVNKSNKLGWTHIEYKILEAIFGIKFICHIPEVSHYWGVYSENEWVDILMTVLSDNIKLKGVEFYNGKGRDGYLKDRYEYDVLRRSLITFTLDGYGWNNKIYATVDLRYLFDYNYKIIIDRCEYEDHIKTIFEKYDRYSSDPELFDSYKILTMLELYKCKLSFKPIHY